MAQVQLVTGLCWGVGWGEYNCCSLLPGILPTTRLLNYWNPDITTGLPLTRSSIWGPLEVKIYHFGLVGHNSYANMSASLRLKASGNILFPHLLLSSARPFLQPRKVVSSKLILDHDDAL